jgi:hypothetical protein
MAIYKDNPRRERNGAPYISALRGRATSSAFDLLGVRFVAGRSFTTQETDSERAYELARVCRTCDLSLQRNQTADEVVGVAVISETVADRFWPRENPIGRQFYDSPSIRRTVVGVISNFYQSASAVSAVTPAVYYPFSGTGESASFIVKLDSQASSDLFSTSAAQAVRRIDPVIPPPRIHELEGLTTDTMRDLRTASWLMSCFSLLAIVVAGLGIYAIATLNAEAKRREMAIRMALGATNRSVRWLTIRRSIGIGIVALPIGFLLGWVVSQQLASLLFQVSGSDPINYVTSGVVLLFAVFIAAGVPVLRLSSRSPVGALRGE